MSIIALIYTFITYGVTAVIVAVIVLVLLRTVFNYADVNPFTWSALTIRRLTDPLIAPVRRALVRFGIEPRIAPLVTVLLVILVGWFTTQLASSILNTLAGVWYALTSRQSGGFVAVAGYLLYGLLALYTLLIFIRVIFSWGMVRYRSPFMRFLVNITEPLLAPLRRVIPPVAMFDISPIVALVIVWLFQAAVAGTLLRGWPIHFL